MDIVSLTNNAVRLHKSASDLSTVCEYQNIQKSDVFVNFSNLPINSSFIKYWRHSKSTKVENDSCIEIWRVKKDKDTAAAKLDMVSKSMLTGLTALGISKKSPNPTTFATGFSTGKIKVRQFSKDYKILNEFVAPHPASSSVTFLDYNSTNENFASVYENGLINIYSLQTFVKFDSLKLDKASTVARFHPSKRTHLAIASFNGMTTLYDIFSKKVLYKNASAHSAPCSDVQFSDNFFLSCGYDGLVNITDIRQQKIGVTVKGTYGWTSLAISNCGAYFCGGNMHTELITYDMRSFKKPLASARVENGNHKISRVDFVNYGSDLPSAESQIDISNAIRSSLEKVEVEENSSNHETNDNFIEDIVDFHRGRISDFSSNAVQHGMRVSVSTPTRSFSRISDFNPNQNTQDDFPTETDKTTLPFDDSCVTKNRRKTSGGFVSEGTTLKRRTSLMTPNLHHINEEKENDAKALNTPTINISYASSNGSLKKKDDVVENDQDESFKSANAEDESKKSIDASPGTSTSISTATASGVIGNFDFRKEFDNLKNELSEKIHIEVGMLAMDESFHFVQLMGHVFEQKCQLQARISMIEESMGILMNDDFKINRIMELQAENDELRKQNQDLLRRMSQ